MNSIKIFIFILLLNSAQLVAQEIKGNKITYSSSLIYGLSISSFSRHLSSAGESFGATLDINNVFGQRYMNLETKFIYSRSYFDQYSKGYYDYSLLNESADKTYLFSEELKIRSTSSLNNSCLYFGLGPVFSIDVLQSVELKHFKGDFLTI